MRTLIGLAIALFVLWVLGFLVFRVAGMALHLLLIVAVILFIWGAIRKNV